MLEIVLFMIFYDFNMMKFMIGILIAFHLRFFYD